MAARLLITLKLAMFGVVDAGDDVQPARRICRPGPQRPDSSSSNHSVLVIGDSISLGQMGPLTKLLCPIPGSDCITTVSHGPWSGDGGALDSKYAMDTDVKMIGAGMGPPWVGNLSDFSRFGDGCLNGTFLTTTMQEPVNYDIITFNYGVHDVDYAHYDEEWVPLDLYRDNLRAIKRTLQSTGAKVLFQASTPVCYNVTTNERILSFNAVAKDVMAEAPAADFNDLYKTITDVCGQPPYNAPAYPGSPNCSYAHYGNVHYPPAGWQLLAESSASAIKKLLSTGANPQAFPIRETKTAQQPVHCPATEDSVATTCPGGSTCMTNAYSSSGFGCCMGYGTNAVQCQDKVHCCPESWTCSANCRLGSCSCEPPVVV